MSVHIQKIKEVMQHISTLQFLHEARGCIAGYGRNLFPKGKMQTEAWGDLKAQNLTNDSPHWSHQEGEGVLGDVAAQPPAQGSSFSHKSRCKCLVQESPIVSSSPYISPHYLLAVKQREYEMLTLEHVCGRREREEDSAFLQWSKLQSTEMENTMTWHETLCKLCNFH